MSITDELRKYAHDCCARIDDDIHAIADRIDAEHKKACDDAWDNGYEADYLGIEKWLTEHPQVMEHHGWIRLPKDADGEYVHVGDVMENVVCPSVHREVTGVGVECFYGWDEGNGRYSQFDVNRYRHYHAQTVEDVLTEFGIDWEHESDCEDRAALLKEYAAKLKLAEGEDA